MRQYPKMLYRDGPIDGASPVFGKAGIYCAVAVDEAEADAMKAEAGFRESVFAPPFARDSREPVAPAPRRGRPPKSAEPAP